MIDGGAATAQLDTPRLLLEASLHQKSLPARRLRCVCRIRASELCLADGEDSRVRVLKFNMTIPKDLRTLFIGRTRQQGKRRTYVVAKPYVDWQIDLAPHLVRGLHFATNNKRN
jgi:hypothetical protein